MEGYLKSGDFMKSSFTQHEKRSNLILTTIQYTTLILFVVLSPKVATGAVWITIEIIGIVIAFWAIIEMRIKSKISIAPLPRSGAQLISSGPYRYIRHPMYLSLLLMFVPLIVSHYNLLRLLVLGVLYVNLLFKLLFEEAILKENLEGYADYMQKSWRIIPFVF